MAYKPTLLEQETIINYNRAEGTASVYTFEPSLKKKLKEMAEEFEGVYIEKTEDSWGAVEYIIPKKLVSIRKPKQGKKLTEEEKKKLAERLAKNRDKGKKSQ